MSQSKEPNESEEHIERMRQRGEKAKERVEKLDEKIRDAQKKKEHLYERRNKPG
jgi:hypothetical protein